MPGLKQKFNLNLWVLSALIASTSLAHVPYPGQIFRFQAALIKNEPTFTATGKALLNGASVPTELKFYGPGNYDLVMDNVPARFHRKENQSGAWVLRRNQSSCTLQAYGVSVNCGPARFWALMEFFSDVQKIGNSLVSEGFYSQEDAQWIETDSRQTSATVNRTKLVLSSNGTRPMAALQVTGLTNESGVNASPYIQFDQTFLKPIQAKFVNQGDPITLSGQADLDVKKDKPRFSYILLNKVTVAGNSSETISFTRSEPKAVKLMRGPEFVQSPAGLDALEEHLSPAGRNLLQALLLTH